jgi:hypothetical protein
VGQIPGNRLTLHTDFSQKTKGTERTKEASRFGLFRPFRRFYTCLRMLLHYIIVTICLIFVSNSKGYSVWAWALSGVFGLAALAHFPDIGCIMGKGTESEKRIRKKGNQIGVIFSVITFPTFLFLKFSFLQKLS